MIPVRLMGPMARYTGYAVGFRGLVRKLAERGDLSIDLRATKELVPEGTEPQLLELLNSGRDYSRLGVLCGFPLYRPHLGTRYKIVYSMYEADDIPFEWKCEVEQADEVWVPTKFCARVFGQYNRKIRIVPWGIDTDVFKRGKRKKHSDFVFGAVGVQSPRKGTDVMVKAFGNAFGGRDGVKLLIKSRDTRSMPPINNPQIEVIEEDWAEERLVQFYRDIDCLLEPSRGEGVGCPPLQAAFCGTPAIATKWGGLVDFIDECGIYGLNIKGLSRADSIGAKGAHWAEPDENHLAELMQWAVDTRPSVDSDLSRWTLDNMAKVFTDCLTYSWGACQK